MGRTTANWHHGLVSSAEDQPPEPGHSPYPASPHEPPNTWSEPPAAPPATPGAGRKRAGRIATAGVAGAALASKAGLFAKIFAVGKGLALLAKLKTVLSLFVSVGVYAIFWGWRFALGFVLLMFVHELGHVVAFKAQGKQVTGLMFIPLLGAYTEAKGEHGSVAEQAWSALAGPIAGAASAYLVLYAADFTDSLLLRALAYTAFLLNVFNLIPMLPLDGGHVAGALHPALWWVGVGLAVALLLWRPSPILFLVLILGGVELWRRRKARRAGVPDEYLQVPIAARQAIAATYAVTAIACFYGMHIAYVATPA